MKRLRLPPPLAQKKARSIKMINTYGKSCIPQQVVNYYDEGVAFVYACIWSNQKAAIKMLKIYGKLCLPTTAQKELAKRVAINNNLHEVIQLLKEILIDDESPIEDTYNLIVGCYFMCIIGLYVCTKYMSF